MTPPEVSQALLQAAGGFEVLQAHSIQPLLDICQRAAALYCEATLDEETPQAYVERLSESSGLPTALGRFNMGKIRHILESLPEILKGLTRSLPLEVLERGWGDQDGVPVSFYPRARALAIVLPSNSPGVNGLWQICLPLRIPVVLKPGPLDPWTPRRIVAALRAAGAPPEAHTLLATDHAGSQALVAQAERVLLFGHDRTTALFADSARVQKHGTGHSKIVLGPDAADRWEDYLDLMVESVLSNSGRSCINASAILTPAHGAAIAEALARRLGPIQALPLASEQAVLGSFPQPLTAQQMDQEIEADLAGAREVTAAYRGGPRLTLLGGHTFLRPTVVHCSSPTHPLADREFHFPYVSVVDVTEPELLSALGRPLVVTAITQEAGLRRRLLDYPIPRLNFGPLATNRVAWTQPHGGNLFDFLYERRAIQHA